MSGDYSRTRFDPRKHFSSVLMQQGRVQLDSDWNELAHVFDRRLRAERADTLGRYIVPRRTPHAFQIMVDGPRLTIGTGRMYVDGLMPENHGDPAALQQLDPVLHELRGVDPIDYTTGQPYFPAGNVPAVPTQRPFLVYLDTWQREVTFIEDPSLVESAVGIDTATRTQTAWRVRILTDVATAPSSADFDPLQKSPPAYWADLVRPPTGRLTTALDDTGDPAADPCLIPPSGGYRGLENQLYRVEIHQPGGPGTATFKWSRDNAAISAQVTALAGAAAITVSNVGRDAVLRFNRGDWIELHDDNGEPDGHHGALLQIQRVDDDARLLAFETPIPPGFATTPEDLAARHTRVRRWDTSASKTGDLRVPADGSPVPLEHGITVRFTVAAETLPDGETASPPFRAGDHWTFAARTADATVEALASAAPHGHHHHFAPLAWIDPAGAQVVDLRTLFPGASTSGVGDCDLQVTAVGHNLGETTIQSRIDELRKLGGGSLCLGRGVFYITADALRIEQLRGVTIRGQGVHTMLVRQFTAPPPAPGGVFDGQGVPPPDDSELAGFGVDTSGRATLRIRESADITISDLVIVSSAAANARAPAVAAHTVADLTLERCHFLHLGRSSDPAGSPALGLSGAIVRATIEHNTFVASLGIGTVERQNLLLADLEVACNSFSSDFRGIHLADAFIVHARRTRITANDLSCGERAIHIDGLTAAAGLVDIDANTVDTDLDGIIVGAARSFVRNNTVRRPHRADRPPAQGPFLFSIDAGDRVPAAVGIGVAATALGFNSAGLGRGRATDNTQRHLDIRIDDNTIAGFAHGVHAEARVAELSIRRNHIDRSDTTGITVSGDLVRFDGAAIVEANTVRAVATAAPNPSTVAGISILGCARAIVRDNTLERIGDIPPLLMKSGDISAISVDTCRQLTVTGNHMFDIGPSGPVQIAPAFVCAINLLDILETLDITGNTLAFTDARAHGVACRALLDQPSLSAHGPIVYSQSYILAPRVIRRRIAVLGNNFTSIMSNQGQGLAGAAVTIVQHGLDLRFADNQILLVVPVQNPVQATEYYFYAENRTPPGLTPAGAQLAILDNTFLRDAPAFSGVNLTHVHVSNILSNRCMGNYIEGGALTGNNNAFSGQSAVYRPLNTQV